MGKQNIFKQMSSQTGQRKTSEIPTYKLVSQMFFSTQFGSPFACRCFGCPFSSPTRGL